MRGLFHRLTSERAEPLDELDSVAANIEEILNTRLGNSVSARGFGVDSFVDALHRFPHAAQILETRIKNAIETFEPRLQRPIKVRWVESENPLQLQFQVVARTRAGRQRVRFSTNISSEHRVHVEQLPAQ